MPDLFKLRSKKRKENSFSNHPEIFNETSRGRLFPSREFSLKETESIVKDELDIFKAHMKEIKETSLMLKELERMHRSGEVAENIYNAIKAELTERMTTSFEEFFKLKESLELIKARAKIAYVKEKAKIDEQNLVTVPTEEIYIYSAPYGWEKIISNIDQALSSLTIEEEISFLERYLSFTKEGNPSGETFRTGRELCRKRLESIQESWNLTRREKIERLIALEREVSQLKEKIKETEVRFAIGYYDEASFETQMSSLKADLQRAEGEISDLRKYIDEMDRRLFRCSELLKGKS